MRVASTCDVLLPMQKIRFALALALCAVSLPAQQPASGKKWIQLFNGRNLDGWIPKITGYETGENFANTFRVAMAC